MFFAALAVPSMAASAPAPKIVIAGAGLHGSALAYYLTRRGVKPIVVEQHSVAAAASGKGRDAIPIGKAHRLHSELVQSDRTSSVVLPPSNVYGNAPCERTGHGTSSTSKSYNFTSTGYSKAYEHIPK